MRRLSSVCSRSEHIVLILRRHVVRYLVNEKFRLAFESAPDSSRRSLSGVIDRNANQAEPAIQLLGVALGTPPVGTRRFTTGRGVVEADRVIHGVAPNPGAGPDVVRKVRRIEAHAANFGF